jgi:hypothetical protein
MRALSLALCACWPAPTPHPPHPPVSTRTHHHQACTHASGASARSACARAYRRLGDRPGTVAAVAAVVARAQIVLDPEAVVPTTAGKYVPRDRVLH